MKEAFSMIDTKLLLGAGVALAGIVTYWISRPSENPPAGKADAAPDGASGEPANADTHLPGNARPIRNAG